MSLVNVKVECVASGEDFGRFAIEPLESGFGLTLGNALRRVLLGALPGAAVTWVKIEGVQHEFSTIPHMKEDTTQFLLNIKGIRLRALSDRAGKMFLDVQGPGIVTAADIETTADFEIVNPELYLATLDAPEARLAVEFNVEHGQGYVPATHSDGMPIGVIPVDAIFTPTRRVNYKVEPLRVEVRNYDRLLIDIWTDGSLSPADALGKAAQTLSDHFATIVRFTRAAPRVGERQPIGTLMIPPHQYAVPIEELELSVRAYNCLKRAGITKVGQVLEMSEEELLNVRNFGRKSLDELRERLVARGFLRLEAAAQATPQEDVAMAPKNGEEAQHFVFEPDEEDVREERAEA